MDVRNIGDQVIRVANAGKTAKVFYKVCSNEKFKTTVVKDAGEYKATTTAHGITFEKTFNEFDLVKEINDILKNVKGAEGIKTKDGMEIYCY